MKYEIYIDRIILINFMMNFYLLLLVGGRTFDAPKIGKVMLGALTGTVGFLIPILCPGPMTIRFLFGFLVSIPGMLKVAFASVGWKGLLRLGEKLAIYAFTIGGVLLFLFRRLSGRTQTVLWVIVAGGVLCLVLLRSRLEFLRQNAYLVGTMKNGKTQVQVNAFVDSGNSLVEPISGKPVCVVDRELYHLLCDEEDGFRVIPYHSIGKQNGIMHACQIEELHLCMEETNITLRQVYIACGEEMTVAKEEDGGQQIRLILHPGLFENNRSRRVRQNVRKHDIKDSTAG